MLNSHFKNTLFFWLSQPPLQTSRIAIMYDVIINGEVRRAVSGLASKLWVPGRAGMHGRPLLSYCPITLLQLIFSVC